MKKLNFIGLDQSLLPEDLHKLSRSFYISFRDNTVGRYAMRIFANSDSSRTMSLQKFSLDSVFK